MKGHERTMQKVLDFFRRRGAIRDDRYWDWTSVVVTKEFDVTTSSASMRRGHCQEEEQHDMIHFESKDGYRLCVAFYEYRDGLYCGGSLEVPASSPFVRDLFHDMNFKKVYWIATGTRVDITKLWYHRYGIYTNHDFDHADLCLSALSQPAKTVSGPAQVLERLVGMMKNLRHYEMLCEKKAKRRQTLVVEEELMQKAWHPSRVEAWLEAGLEM